MGACNCVLVFDGRLHADHSRVYGGLANEKEGDRAASCFRVDAAYGVRGRGCRYAGFGFLTCHTTGFDPIETAQSKWFKATADRTRGSIVLELWKSIYWSEWLQAFRAVINSVINSLEEDD
jgi:hypothetical protein